MDPKLSRPVTVRSLGVAYVIDPALSLSTVCQMLNFDSRFNFAATRDKLSIKKHHRAEAKSKLNENLKVFLTIFACFLSNLLFELK